MWFDSIRMRFEITSVVALLAAGLVVVPSVSAGVYRDSRVEFLRVASSEERAEVDWNSSSIFAAMAEAEENGGSASDLIPGEWKDLTAPTFLLPFLSPGESWLGARDRLYQLEERVAGISPDIREANQRIIAHAEIDLLHARHELGEGRGIFSANGYLDHAEFVDLAGLIEPTRPAPPEPVYEPEPVVDFGTIHFDLDVSSDPVEADRPVLDATARTMRSNPGLVIELSGHTDSLGSVAYNLALSGRRTAMVKDYMISHYGVDPDRIRTVAHGEALPVASNETPEGRARNRRVEIRAVR